MGRVLGIRVSEAVADVDLVRVDRKRIVLCGASRRVWPRHVTGRIQHAAVLSGCLPRRLLAEQATDRGDATRALPGHARRLQGARRHRDDRRDSTYAKGKIAIGVRWPRSGNGTSVDRSREPPDFSASVALCVACHVLARSFYISMSSFHEGVRFPRCARPKLPFWTKSSSRE